MLHTFGLLIISFTCVQSAPALDSQGASTKPFWIPVPSVSLSNLMFLTLWLSCMQNTVVSPLAALDLLHNYSPSWGPWLGKCASSWLCRGSLRYSPATPRDPETLSLRRREGTTKIAGGLLWSRVWVRNLGAGTWLLGRDSESSNLTWGLWGMETLPSIPRSSLVLTLCHLFQLEWRVVFILRQSLEAYCIPDNILPRCFSSQEKTMC